MGSTPRFYAKSVTGYQIRAKYNGQWTTLIENTGAADSRVEVKGRAGRRWRWVRKTELDPFDTSYTPHLAKRNDRKNYVAFLVLAIRGTLLSPINNSRNSGAVYYDPSQIYYTSIRQVSNQRTLHLTWNKPVNDAESVISYQIFRRRFFFQNDNDEDWQIIANHTNLNNRSYNDPIDDRKVKGANVDWVKYLYKIKAIRPEMGVITDNVEALLQPLKTRRIFVDHLTKVDSEQLELVVQVDADTSQEELDLRQARLRRVLSRCVYTFGLVPFYLRGR